MTIRRNRILVVEDDPAVAQSLRAGLAFEWALPETPVAVLGAEAQLKAALTNLLDNVLKFTPEGGRICLGCRLEGETAVLWVEDTGIGLPEADLPHLFERFYRGRNATAYPGSGLGLAIVKAVVERHEGQVLAERTGIQVHHPHSQHLAVTRVSETCNLMLLPVNGPASGPCGRISAPLQLIKLPLPTVPAR